MTDIEKTEAVRKQTEVALNKLIQSIGPIPISNSNQLPLGWRKAAKGRTVWRILEEIITQNLQVHSKKFGVVSADCGSEVGVYDARLNFKNGTAAYINIKSAAESGSKERKDDISKAIGLKEFYTEVLDRDLLVATFSLRFRSDLHVQLIDVKVVPVSWIPDIYVNPSNNGNLQSSKYKDLSSAVKRSNSEFLTKLKQEMLVAEKKRKEREITKKGKKKTAHKIPHKKSEKRMPTKGPKRRRRIK